MWQANVKVFTKQLTAAMISPIDEKLVIKTKNTAQTGSVAQDKMLPDNTEVAVADFSKVLENPEGNLNQEDNYVLKSMCDDEEFMNDN